MKNAEEQFLLFALYFYRHDTESKAEQLKSKSDDQILPHLTQEIMSIREDEDDTQITVSENGTDVGKVKVNLTEKPKNIVKTLILNNRKLADLAVSDVNALEID